MDATLGESNMQTLRSSAIALAVLAGVAVAAGPATADDHDDHPPIWLGWYAGLHLGYGEAGSADGVVGGAQIGSNWQSGQIIYGWEADLSLSDISDSERFTTCVAPGDCVTSTASGSIDWMVTARGRLGYIFQPNLMAYATAGLGIVGGSGSTSLTVPGFRNDLITVDDTEIDFVYGLGIESRLSGKSTVRVEYLGFADTEIDVIRAGLSFRLGNFF